MRPVMQLGEWGGLSLLNFVPTRSRQQWCLPLVAALVSVQCQFDLKYLLFSARGGSSDHNHPRLGGYGGTDNGRRLVRASSRGIRGLSVSGV